MNKIKVRLVKSINNVRRTHRDTVHGLGLKKINQVSELADTPAVRGMIDKVSYLVRIDA
jgi:large subunit ribosomal protein L30